MKYCIDCGDEKSLSEFNTSGNSHRPECKSCEKSRRERRRVEDLFLATVNSMADGILKRTKYAIDSPKNRTYKERGIKSLIGENRSTIRATLIANFESDIKTLLELGERPSVDRIDAYGHYSIENIQIIPLRENISRADLSNRSIKIIAKRGERLTEFCSISLAAKELNIKRDTIYRHLDKGTTTKRGFSFSSV